VAPRQDRPRRGRTSRDQVKKLENEQKTLGGKIEELMAEWESLEGQIAELKG
jgi:peptidoglycan hydrolase CwlO-like protein